MIIHFINFYQDGTYYYYDMYIEENNIFWGRLSGVIFESEPTEDDMVQRATDIINGIDSEKIIKQIYIGYGDISIYSIG